MLRYQIHETYFDPMLTCFQCFLVIIVDRLASLYLKMANSSISTCLSSSYKVEVNLKFSDDLDTDNVIGTIIDLNILNQFGGVATLYQGYTNAKIELRLTVLVCDVKSLKCEGVEMCDSNPKLNLNFINHPIVDESSKIFKRLILTATQSFENMDETPGKLKSLSLKLVLSFEASSQQVLKQKLVHGFHEFLFQHSRSDSETDSETDSESESDSNSEPCEEIKVVCGDKKIFFDKKVLCSISDVFQTIFENPNNIESQSGTVHLEDIRPETVESFKRLLHDDTVQESDLNVGALLLADRYNVQPIAHLCLDHLKTNVTKENFPEIVKASDLINDKDLQEAAINFARKNIGLLEDDPEVKKFIRANKDCFITVFEEIMFKK